MARVMVTGAQGLLGSSLVPALTAAGHTVIAAPGRRGVPPFDLARADDVLAWTWRAAPEVVVNLAALTDVDACERDPHAAFVANTRIVEHLAAAVRAGAAGALVHVSTDQVYDGAGPHREDAVTIRNTYALSKYAGELAALAVGATVLRTNFVGRSRTQARTSLSDWLVDALGRAEPISVFTNVLFSPLAIDSLVALVVQVIAARRSGIYNLGCRGGGSKADFAFRLAQARGLPVASMRRSELEPGARPARRPLDMRMDCAHFESTFGVTLPGFEAEIERVAAGYDAGTL